MSISRVYLAQGNLPQSKHYLDEAKPVAHKVNSTGHLAEVYALECSLYRKMGNY
jgi:hypothetical protein